MLLLTIFFKDRTQGVYISHQKLYFLPFFRRHIFSFFSFSIVQERKNNPLMVILCAKKNIFLSQWEWDLDP